MAKLTRDDIFKLAQLAKLKLTDKEIDRYVNEISSILEYVEQLKAVNLEGIDPTYQVTGLSNVMRADEEIAYQASKDELLKNAPATEGGHIKVKRMLT